MKQYTIYYWDGDSRLRAFTVEAENETAAMSLCRTRYGSHIGISHCKLTA